jgi:hypothetical protein
MRQEKVMATPRATQTVTLLDIAADMPKELATVVNGCLIELDSIRT